MQLSQAICEGRENTALELIEVGESLDASDEFGLAPLHLAVVHGRLALLRTLLETKLKPNPKTKVMLDTSRPADRRVFRPDGAFFFRKFTDAPIGAGRCFDKGATPLHLAAALGDAEAVELLLARKARPTMKDGVGATPLHLACLGGYARVVELLLAKKHDIDGVTKVRKSIRFYDVGTTPLLAALESGDRETIELVVKAGANWQASTKYGCTALLFAARGGCMWALEQLHAAGVAVDAPARYSDFPLREAVFFGHHALASRMLELGAATHESPNGSQAALRLAIERDDQRMRDLLLAGGAAPLPDHGICHAARGNDVGYIEGFAAAGRDLNIIEDDMSPLMHAACKGHVAATQALLAAGANPSLRGKRGTALHYGLDNNKGEVVDLLLAAGSDCSLVDENGANPLMCLVFLRLDVGPRAARMIELGANPHATNSRGVSAIEGLRRMDRHERADELAALAGST